MPDDLSAPHQGIPEGFQSKDVYFKYLPATGLMKRKFLISAFRFDGEKQWHRNMGQVWIRPPQFRVLLCTCGANNWKDHGGHVNEYVCGSCGNYVEVVEKKQGTTPD